MHDYLKEVGGTRTTPQSEPIPGSDQVENSAGGYAYSIGPFERLKRWLVLGSEGGSYYAGERDLTVQNIACVREALEKDATRAIKLIRDISTEGRAPKNDQAIYALAIACSHKDELARKWAFSCLNDVCRTGTHLFQFVSYMEQHRGWGRMARRGVGNWYTAKTPEALAYQLVKYRQRGGWTHRDVLRLAHPAGDVHGLAFAWATQKTDQTERAHTKPNDALEDLIVGFELAQVAATPERTAQLIERHGLPREAINPDHLTSPAVWGALLEDEMPMTALIRNLGNMSRVGLLRPLGPYTDYVVLRLTDTEALAKARVHPITVLAALRTYARGHGLRGKGEWEPVPQIVDALDEAFYLAFKSIEPSGKRTLIALDVSGSMDGANYGYSGFPNCAGMPDLSPREASACLAMVQARVGDPYHVVAFSAGGSIVNRERTGRGIVPVTLTPRQRLDDVIRSVSDLWPGGTDCALPMLYALDREIEVDTFLIMTDNETWAGAVHPMQALQRYRRETGIDAKLVVNGMTATDFSIADPNDRGALDVVGFDSAAPQLISEFSAGRL